MSREPFTPWSVRPFRAGGMPTRERKPDIQARETGAADAEFPLHPSKAPSQETAAPAGPHGRSAAGPSATPPPADGPATVELAGAKAPPPSPSATPPPPAGVADGREIAAAVEGVRLVVDVEIPLGFDFFTFAIGARVHMLLELMHAATGLDRCELINRAIASYAATHVGLPALAGSPFTEDGDLAVVPHVHRPATFRRPGGDHG